MAHDGTYVNTPTLGVTGLVTGDPDTAVAFATDESVVSDETFTASYPAFTLGAIFKPANLTANGTVWGLSAFTGLIGITGPDGSGTFYFIGDTAGAGWTVISDTPVLANAVCRLIATWDGTTATLYLNGAVVGTDTTAGTPAITSAVFMAASDVFSNAVDGTVDECFFVNAAASPAEVATIDNAWTGTGDAEDAVNALSPFIFWRLGEASGTTAFDSAGFPAPTPTVDSLTPSSGSELGGNPVVIAGSAFTGAAAVTFDGISVAFTEDSDTQITATAPAHAPGTGQVVVT